MKLGTPKKGFRPGSVKSLGEDLEERCLNARRIRYQALLQEAQAVASSKTGADQKLESFLVTGRDLDFFVWKKYKAVV